MRPPALCADCGRPMMPDHSVCFSDDCVRERREAATRPPPDPRRMLRQVAVLLRECVRDAEAHLPSLIDESERFDCIELRDNSRQTAVNLEALAAESDDRRVFGTPGQLAYAAGLGQLDAATEQLPRRKLEAPSPDDLTVAAETLARLGVSGAQMLEEPASAVYAMRFEREKLEKRGNVAHAHALDRVIRFWTETPNRPAKFDPIDTGQRFPEGLAVHRHTCSNCGAMRDCTHARVSPAPGAIKNIAHCCAECLSDLVVGAKRFSGARVEALARGGRFVRLGARN
jgi:hypothetical protein